MEHGGDLEWAEAVFGRPAAPWIDLSTGINPWPYPFTPPPGEAWSRLPDSQAERRLCDAAAEAYSVPMEVDIVAAPGTQALIQLLPRLRSRARVAIVGPTYGGHAPAWAAAGHDVTMVDGIDVPDADVVVVTNPNNPDGRTHDPERLRALGQRLAVRGGWLVVDEAFADVAPAVSVLGGGALDGCVVLRSFGKFYGLAGARLGFAVAAPDIAVPLSAALGPWPVSGPAAAIGAEALADRRWAGETRARLGTHARDLDAVLEDGGLKVIGGTVLFRLVAHPDAAALFRFLARRGILVRAYADHPRWLRIGLPADGAARDRLTDGLAAWRGEPAAAP